MSKRCTPPLSDQDREGQESFLRRTLRVLSVLRSKARRLSGKKKWRRPKLSRSLRHTSLAKALMAPEYCTGSSNTTCSNQQSLSGGYPVLFLRWNAQRLSLKNGAP